MTSRLGRDELASTPVHATDAHPGWDFGTGPQAHPAESQRRWSDARPDGALSGHDEIRHDGLRRPNLNCRSERKAPRRLLGSRVG
jgi:hypothetical protein